MRTRKETQFYVKSLYIYKPITDKGNYWFNWYIKPLRNLSDLWYDNSLTKIQKQKIHIYFVFWDLLNLNFNKITKDILDTDSINKLILLPNKFFNVKYYLVKKNLKNYLIRFLIQSILNFSFIYNVFFYKPFYFWRSRYIVKVLSKINIFKFQLKFKFKANKIVPTFGTRFNLYFSASEGVFNSRLDRPKRFKKNKAIKFIMAKYLRKLLIVSDITWMVLVIRNNPLFLNEILQLLNEPSVHKYLNPFSKKVINEFSKQSLKRPHIFKFSYFHYIFTKFYGINRHPRPRGKVKRKIRRKLVRLVNKVD